MITKLSNILPVNMITSNLKIMVADPFITKSVWILEYDPMFVNHRLKFYIKIFFYEK